MSRTMRRISTFAAALATGLLISGAAFGASSDSVSVTVTITQEISINIVEATVALGTLAKGSTAVSSTSAEVVNDGSGITETYSLSLTNPGGWTAGTPGLDTYRLAAMFNTTQPASGDYATIANFELTTTPQASTGTKFAGNQAGASVPWDESRYLWFRFEAPTATAVATEQDITVTVTASTP